MDTSLRSRTAELIKATVAAVLTILLAALLFATVVLGPKGAVVAILTILIAPFLPSHIAW